MIPPSSGTTHICTKCTFSRCSSPPWSRQESFFSLCRIPVPALIRWASPGVDDAVVPGGVLVHQGSLHDPGDDLHIPVRMRLEAEARRHDVVVVHQQQPVVGVVVVVVGAEGKE